MTADNRCGVECDHTELEHDAFDRGVADGEAGRDENPYNDAGLVEAWLDGHSVGDLNRLTPDPAILNDPRYMTWHDRVQRYCEHNNLTEQDNEFFSDLLTEVILDCCADPESATWATLTSTCHFCGLKVKHVCTALLKETQGAEVHLCSLCVVSGRLYCPHLHQDYPATPINKCLDCGQTLEEEASYDKAYEQGREAGNKAFDQVHAFLEAEMQDGKSLQDAVKSLNQGKDGNDSH